MSDDLDAAFDRYFANVARIRRRATRGALAAWVLACLVIFFFPGCGEPAPDEGYIREKRFDPAHWESGYETVYMPEYRCKTETNYDYNTDSYRTEQVCGTEMVAHEVWEARHRWVDDDWDFLLEECTVNDEGKRKCRKGWHDVTEDEFDSYRTGQHYPDPA